MRFDDYQKILAHRELRAFLIRHALQENNSTIIEVTINSPGKEKDSPLLRALHLELLSRLIPLTDAHLIHIEQGDQGPFALLKTSLTPESVKTMSTEIEAATPAGRLYDIDVFHRGGPKLSRKGVLRSCYICNQPAAVCARSRSHTSEQLAENMRRRIIEDPAYPNILRAQRFLSGEKTPAVPSFLEDSRVATISRCAVKALAAEADLSPKPGLVDSHHNGSHTDMNLQLLISSATSLGSTFYQMANAAAEAQQPDGNLFSRLREIGIIGEQKMFAATNGVNTHKGLIFSCGILSAAAAVHDTPQSMQAYIRELSSGLVQRDFLLEKPPAEESYGERLYRSQGITGARGEAEQGFPAVFTSFQSLKKLLKTYDLNTTLLQTLVELMSSFIDTNVLGRGGREALSWMHKATQEYLDQGGVPADQGFKKLQNLNSEFVNRNISPGGCADTLACTLFLYFLEKEFKGR